MEEELKAAQESLDRPNRDHQAYLDALAQWESRRAALIGEDGAPESLKGLEADLKALDSIPASIGNLRSDQEELSRQVHSSRASEAGVYRTLYGPVQSFIETHALAKEHLQLEFKVGVVEDGFIDGLLLHLNQNRKGSFYGAEDGRSVAKSLAATVDWSSWESVKSFLEAVSDRLHNDRRTEPVQGVLIKDQISKGKTVAELYAWLYGLGYLKPRYLLRWEGKDVAQLSPGERGTLLLIFYLLIDGSDLPLVIDQPEANLDNETVAKKLVHCIREARDRRQVVIVTHNPNLAVVCDADQIIHAALDKADGNRITYTAGSLENPIMNRFAINVLEGSRPAFNTRDATYKVAGE